MSIVAIGTDHPCGCYVLRIHLATSTHLRFGGFKKGKLIELYAGDYAYVGSALARQGATSLARRLIRHATRSGAKPPHPIRAEMLRQFASIGLGSDDFLPRNPKRMHWNIDHLLDLAEAELQGAYLLRTKRKLEASLGKFIEDDPHTVAFAKGLGANDIPGNTHILRVEAPARWWSDLGSRLVQHFHLAHELEHQDHPA